MVSCASCVSFFKHPSYKPLSDLKDNINDLWSRDWAETQKCSSTFAGKIAVLFLVWVLVATSFNVMLLFGWVLPIHF